MIVRILGDARYEVPDADVPAIEQLDAVLGDALERGDEPAFTTALSDLIGQIRHDGNPVGDDDLRPSDRVVPHEGSTLQEVRDLLDAGV